MASEIDDLGVLLDKDLTFIPHISKIVVRANCKMDLIKRVDKNFKDIRIFKNFYFSLVWTQLDYASPV